MNNATKNEFERFGSVLAEVFSTAKQIDQKKNRQKLLVQGDLSTVTVTVTPEIADQIEKDGVNAGGHLALAKCFERVFYAGLTPEQRDDLKVDAESGRPGFGERLLTDYMESDLKRAFKPATYEWLMDSLCEDLEIERGTTTVEREFDNVWTNVSSLCEGVGLPEPKAAEEMVAFGHGGGHRRCKSGEDQEFYIDLDQLEGETKEDRMRSAVEVLAIELGSWEALLALKDAGFLKAEPSAIRWPERNKGVER